MASRSLGSLTIDVLARIGGFRQGMEQAERVAKTSSKSIQTSVQRNIGDGFQSANNSVQEFTSRLVSMAAAYATIRTAISSADEWTNLGNRIRLVTNGSAEFEAAQSNIVNIARETRQSLSATGELYQRIATNQKELGLSGQEVADVVKTISQSLVISGASAQSAQAALVQLGQAFASGVLRGEELNSVLEQAPALARTIADGLGVPIGKLRELGAAGKLTTAEVIAALQGQSDAVDSNFRKISTTIGQALTVAQTNLTVFIGELDQASGASAALASSIASLSNNLPAVATAFAAFASVKVAQNLGERATALARNRVELIASTKADLAAAQAAELSARANLLAAQADVRRAQSIGGSVSVSAQAATATLAHRQATLALAAAQTQAAAATGILSGAMKSALAFVGGPAGLLFLVGSTAASFLLFRDNTAAADRALIDFNGTADDSIAKFKELNRQQQAGEILRLTKELNSSYSDINQQVAQLANTISGLGSGADLAGFIRSSSEIAEQFRSGSISADEFSQRISDLRKRTVEGANATESFTNTLVTAESGLAASARQYDNNRNLLDEFGGAQRNAAVAVDGTTTALRQQEAALQAGQTALTKYVADLNGNVQKANISLIRKTKGEFAALQVEVGNVINAAGGIDKIDPAQRKSINEYLEQSKKIIDQETAFDAQKKKTKETNRDATKSARDIARASLQMAKDIRSAQTELDGSGNSITDGYARRLDEITSASEEFLRRGIDSGKVAAFRKEMEELAKSIKNKEIAEFTREFNLSSDELEATLNNTSTAAIQYKRSLYDLDKQLTAGLINQEDYERRKSLLQRESTSQFDKTVENMRFEIDLLRITNVERERAIALRQLSIEAGSQQDSEITGLIEAREQLQKQIEVMDSIRDVGRGLFVDLATGSKSFKDSFVDALDTIRDRLIALAAEKFIEQIFGQSGSTGSGNAGTFAAFFGSLLGGSRANGGPVSAGSLYEVGENGRPEILTDARGKQYLIPGNNSNVSPVGAGGGAGSPNFAITINIEDGTTTQQQSGDTNQAGKELVGLVESVVNRWWIKQNKGGGAVYNQRMGG